MLICYKKSNGEILWKSGVRKAQFIPNIEWNWNILPALKEPLNRDEVEFMIVKGEERGKLHSGRYTAKVGKSKKLVDWKETQEYKDKKEKAEQEKNRKDALRQKAKDKNLSVDEIQEIISELL